jgi:hypothetical protein
MTCKSIGLDPLVAGSQMELDTGHLTSKPSQPPQRNPAGIGITGPGVTGVSFPNWRKAARAHVGRLAAFAIPKGKGTLAQKALIAEALGVRNPFRTISGGLRFESPAYRAIGRRIRTTARRSRESRRRSRLSAGRAKRENLRRAGRRAEGRAPKPAYSRHSPSRERESAGGDLNAG